MKPLPLLLALSVAANVGLAVSIYSRRPQSGAPATVPADALTEGTARLASAPSLTAMGHAAAKSDSAADDAAYIARLRADGFPPGVIRSLVYLRLGRRYEERLRSLRHLHEYAYWRESYYSSYDSLSREERAAVRAINQEMMTEVKKLLGEDDAVSATEKTYRERTMGNLSPDKIQQVDAINKDYNELMSQISERTKGVVLRSDREELRLLEREKRADLATALTPEELLEYDLHASPSASSVRQRLRYFEPTEGEFRAIAQLQLELDQNFGTSNLSAAEQDRRRTAEKELPAKIQAVLTPERFADYQTTTDGSFGNNAYALRSYGFDLDTVREVTALQRNMTQRAEAVRAQPDLTPAQRVDALAALNHEATTWLNSKLGEKNSASYQKTAGGTWLGKLRSAPAPRSNP